MLKIPSENSISLSVCWRNERSGLVRCLRPGLMRIVDFSLSTEGEGIFINLQFKAIRLR